MGSASVLAMAAQRSTPAAAASTASPLGPTRSSSCGPTTRKTSTSAATAIDHSTPMAAGRDAGRLPLQRGEGVVERVAALDQPGDQQQPPERLQAEQRPQRARAGPGGDLRAGLGTGRGPGARSARWPVPGMRQSEHGAGAERQQPGIDPDDCRQASTRHQRTSQHGAADEDGRAGAADQPVADALRGGAGGQHVGQRIDRGERYGDQHADQQQPEEAAGRPVAAADQRRAQQRACQQQPRCTEPVRQEGGERRREQPRHGAAGQDQPDRLGGHASLSEERGHEGAFDAVGGVNQRIEQQEAGQAAIALAPIALVTVALASVAMAQGPSAPNRAVNIAAAHNWLVRQYESRCKRYI